MASRAFTIRLTDESMALIGDNENLTPRVNQLMARYAWLLDQQPVAVPRAMLADLSVAISNGLFGGKMMPADLRDAAAKVLPPEHAQMLASMTPLQLIQTIEAAEAAALS